uniref:Uncharacterized protein n=2 Tax=Physcomitrium patens TaxID=3218 RepID=A0A7I3ZL73_PHYPA
MLCRGEPFGEDGHRSRYLLNANQALYHLSYSPTWPIPGRSHRCTPRGRTNVFYNLY